MPFDIPKNQNADNNQATQKNVQPAHELYDSLEEVVSQEDFFKEMSQEKEPFEFNKEKFNDPPVVVTDDLDPEVSKTIRNKALKSAEFVVKHLDNALAWGASEVALAENSDEFHAPKEDKKEMITYWADILEANKGDIPTWLMLIISASLTYGPIYRQAFKARAINKELARRAAKAEADLIIEKEKNRKKTVPEADQNLPNENQPHESQPHE